MLTSIGALVDRGQQRATNEDTLGYHLPRSAADRLHVGSVFVVADGMSGQPGGDRASLLAVLTLLSEYYAPAEALPRARLLRAIEAANARIWRESQEHAARQRIGTTIACAAVYGGHLVVGHIGDSRVYLVRAQAAYALTRDHTWVAEAVELGLLSPEEAARHPQRHILGRSLGTQPGVEADTHEVALDPGDRLLLCTNGLSVAVPDATLAALVSELEPAAAATALVAEANKQGGPGNIAVIVVPVVLEESTGPTTPGATRVLA